MLHHLQRLAGNCVRERSRSRSLAAILRVSRSLTTEGGITWRSRKIVRNANEPAPQTFLFVRQSDTMTRKTPLARRRALRKAAESHVRPLSSSGFYKSHSVLQTNLKALLDLACHSQLRPARGRCLSAACQLQRRPQPSRASAFWNSVNLWIRSGKGLRTGHQTSRSFVQRCWIDVTCLDAHSQCFLV